MSSRRRQPVLVLDTTEADSQSSTRDCIRQRPLTKGGFYRAVLEMAYEKTFAAWQDLDAERVKLNEDARVGRTTRAKLRAASQAAAVARRLATTERDQAWLNAAREYWQRHPDGCSQREVAEHLARTLEPKRKSETIRRRLRKIMGQ